MNLPVNSWVLLYLAIALEVGGTLSIKLSQGFSRLVPSLCVIALYGASFTLLSIAVRKIDLGVAYAIWSGVGIIAITCIGFMFFNESINLRKVLSILVIIIGVVSLNLASAR